jgi:RNA polymerase sigma-70 factor (ECF subfamily)
MRVAFKGPARGFLPPAGESASEAASTHARQLDRTLVERARAGDRDAETSLYGRHAHAIARTTRRLLRSQEDVHDVVHDTFVYALEHLDELRDPSAVGAWLLQIAVRQVHRRFRRRRLLHLLGLSGVHKDASAELEELASPHVSPEVRAELALVDAVLAKAAAADRIAWVLRRVEGYALDEVATACACSLATAKRRIGAVDARLRVHVELGDWIDADA